ncbi:MAG: hypothetical protein AAGF87_04185, partial [Bacteroidota bacterium]
ARGHTRPRANSTMRAPRARTSSPSANARPDPEFSFEFTEIEAESIHEGLDQYMDASPVDMAIIVTKQRNFWERLFHRSATKELAFNAKVPLMVFHLEE